MRIVMYLVIIASMLASYLSSADIHLVPGVVRFLPDVLAIGTTVYIFAAGTRQQFRFVAVKYWIIMGAIAFVMICGPLVNREPIGPVLSGMHFYLRAIPFFFLPAVVDFSEADIRRYMKLLLALSLLQCPLAIYQRHEVAIHNEFSGDSVFGTLMISGILSLFLISVLCVMGSLMIRGKIGKVWYALCFVALVIPMSINETKVTVVLLPLSLLVTFALASPRGRRIPVTLSALGLLLAGAAIFVPLYNYYNTLHNPVPFTVYEFFTKSELIGNYMNREAGVGTGEEAGRMTSLTAPVRELSHDPIKLAFGLGMGNASNSSLGRQFMGQYEAVYYNFAEELSISLFMFEIGLFGSSLVLLLHFTVLSDAFFVSKQGPGLFSALAPGYIGAWITITVGLFYLTIHTFESLSFMFWFFSGLMAAQRLRLTAASRQPVRTSSPAKIPSVAIEARRR